MAEPEKSKNTINPGQAPRIKVELKRSGGKCEPLSKTLIVELIRKYNPEWNDPDLTSVTPVISDPKYEGPVGFPGIDPKLEEGHLRHVKGHQFEMKVLNAIKAYSEKEKLGLKIFHDVELCEEKLEALSQVFETDAITFDSKALFDLGFKKDHRTGKPIVNLEVDLIIVSKNSILLIEIKSSPKDVFSAMNQLNRAEKIVTEIIESVCENKMVCVKKMVVIPPYKHRDLTLKAKHNNVTVIFGQDKETEKGQNTSKESQGSILYFAHNSDNGIVLNLIFDQKNEDPTSPLISGDLKF
jgi:hypothetical protein